MDRQFVVLSVEQIQKLVPILESRLPQSAMIYNVTRLFVDNRYSENIQTKFYAYDNNFNVDDGFFFAVQYRKCYNNQSTGISSPTSPTTRMIESLEKALDWSLPMSFEDLDIQLSGVIQEMCARHGKLEYVDHHAVFCMTMPQALSIITPPTADDVVVRELGEENAEIVTERWEHSSAGTSEFMRDSIKTVASSGVFLNSKPVCWAVGSSYGSINALYTENEHRRKGYAEIAMKQCCKHFGERGMIPNVQTNLENFASRSLMEKVGLKYSHNVDCMLYIPPIL